MRVMFLKISTTLGQPSHCGDRAHGFRDGVRVAQTPAAADVRILFPRLLTRGALNFTRDMT